MSGMPDLNSTRLTIRLSLELRARVRAKVRRSNGELSESDVAVLALNKSLKDVGLDSVDVEWVREQMKKNREKRNSQRR